MLKSENLWKLRVNDTHTDEKIMHGIFQAKQVLKEQPTVDAVPVVRCGKCYYKDEKRIMDEDASIGKKNRHFA